MENNSDRMGFALIALSVVAFVLLAVNGPLKSTVGGFFNGFNKWQTATVNGISEITKQDVTHTAYSWSSDGTDRFTTTKPNLNLFDNYDLSSWTDFNLSNWDGVPSASQNNIKYSLVDLGLSVGDTITYQVEVDASKLKTSDLDLVIQFLSKNVWQRNVYGDNKRSSGVYTVTATIPAGIDGLSFPYMSKSNNTVTEIVKARYRKLEKGSIATIWTPRLSDQPKYIGTYTDKNETASQEPSKYTWKLNPDYHE